jgi:hypothetical protein
MGQKRLSSFATATAGLALIDGVIGRPACG